MPPLMPPLVPPLMPACGAGSLSLEGRQAVCAALVAQGKAEWLAKDRTACLVTIQPVPLWAATIQTVVRTHFSSHIVTIEELHSGDEARGTGAGPPAPCAPRAACSDRCTLAYRTASTW